MASRWRQRQWLQYDPLNLLTTVLGGPVASPFSQTNWPNPLQAQQPQENRGFFRAANTQLFGKDRFFGAAGQGPSYDWPNPLRPRYPLQPESSPNIALTTVLVAAPFYQADWPNPQGKRAVSQADCSSSLLVGPLAVPFALRDWPLPSQARQPQENQGFVRASNVQLIGQDKFFAAAGQAPVYDYPNPQRPRYPLQPEPPANVVLRTVFVAAPFFMTDWPNPQVARQAQENRGWVRAANTQLIGQDRFFGAAGQAPVYDWPNPLRPRWPAQADNQSSLLISLFITPFFQTDWPLPQRPRYPVQPEPPPNLLTTVTFVTVFPFALRDWPNPQTPRQPLENKGFVGSVNVLLIGQDRLPFLLTEWPNPQRPRYPLQPEPPPNLLGVYLPPPPPPLVNPDYVWTEGTRGIVWAEATRLLVWAGTQQQGQQKVMTLLSRTLESADYAYDFKNDAAILAGDSISSITSVTVTPQNAIALEGSLPTLGTPTLSEKRVIVRVLAPDEPLGVGGQFLVRFTVLTVSGLTRVGLGIYVVSDQGP